MPVTRRRWLQRVSLAASALTGGAVSLGAAQAATAATSVMDPAAWQRLQTQARGQTVRFNAWAGSERINAYLQWVAAEVQRRHGVTLQHVKISDAAEVVKRVRAEKAASRAEGSVDLIWINGENFLTMKREGLLFGPWAEALPAFAAVDVSGKPTTRLDFAEPVEGLEAPWGMAQLTFMADSTRLGGLAPDSLAALTAWAKAHPGRFTYPKPPAFHGTTFLKQALLELSPDRTALARPYQAEAFAKVTAPLWPALDALHPHLWRQGRQFPASAEVMRQMLADGELWISLTFNPAEAASEIAAGTLPATTVSYQHSAGTLGNTHFVAIPFNAPAKAAAQVVANFLLSPEAQARKADIQHWGDPTVLALDRLSPAERAAFGDSRKVPGAVQRPAPALPEPHGSWVDPLEQEWLRRYGH